MKKHLTLFALILSSIIAKAQTTINTDKPSSKPTIDTSEVFTAVQKAATFPGGIDKFYKYLEKNSKYPIATEQGEPSLKVYLTFIVERNGSLTNIKIMRGAVPKFDVEAVRLVKASGLWIPGEQSGYKIRQQYTVAVSFQPK